MKIPTKTNLEITPHYDNNTWVTVRPHRNREDHHQNPYGAPLNYLVGIPGRIQEGSDIPGYSIVLFEMNADEYMSYAIHNSQLEPYPPNSEDDPASRNR